MNLPLPRLLLHAPCPASIRHATGFQIDSVSYDNQIRDESLRGLPRERDGGEGGGGNSMSAREEDGLHRNGLPFPNSIGQTHSFKQRKIKHQSPSFWTEWTTPPIPTNIDKSKQNISLCGERGELAGVCLRYLIRSLRSDDFQHQISARDVRIPESQFYSLKGTLVMNAQTQVRCQ